MLIVWGWDNREAMLLRKLSFDERIPTSKSCYRPAISYSALAILRSCVRTTKRKYSCRAGRKAIQLGRAKKWFPLWNYSVTIDTRCSTSLLQLQTKNKNDEQQDKRPDINGDYFARNTGDRQKRQNIEIYSPATKRIPCNEIWVWEQYEEKKHKCFYDLSPDTVWLYVLYKHTAIERTTAVERRERKRDGNQTRTSERKSKKMNWTQKTNADNERRSWLLLNFSFFFLFLALKKIYKNNKHTCRDERKIQMQARRALHGYFFWFVSNETASTNLGIFLYFSRLCFGRNAHDARPHRKSLNVDIE